MATGTRGGYTRDRRSGGGFGAFLVGILFTLGAIGVGGWGYLKYGHPPVAAADKAFPLEAQIVHVPLGARIAKELEQPPFGTSEDVYEAGAKIYVASCASCHGTPGHDSPYAKWMYPSAPQLWKKHARNSVVGVSDDEPGETYWKVKNGIRLTGMPSYEHLYSVPQMWQVSLLLKNADQPLPDPVMKILESANTVNLAHEKDIATATVSAQ
jgi:mono/diheme cytochrome c family protein